MQAPLLVLLLACLAPLSAQAATGSQASSLDEASGPLVGAARAYFAAIAEDDRADIDAFVTRWFDPEALGGAGGAAAQVDAQLGLAQQIGALERHQVLSNSAARLEVLTRRAEEGDWLLWTFYGSDGAQRVLRGVGVANAEAPDGFAAFDGSSASALAAELQRRLGTPAVGVALVRAGNELDAAVVGLRRFDREEPALLTDRFHIGSCSKSVTALLVQSLVDDGLLSWSDTLGELFGEDMTVDPAYAGATLADVARHRARLVGHSADIADAMATYSELPGSPTEQRARYVSDVLARPPETPVGSTEYSNAGFSLLGHACERATTASYEELVNERVLTPLGVTSARFGWPATASDPDGVWGHGRVDGALEVFEENVRLGAFLAPAGDLALSISDFARVSARWLEPRGIEALLQTAPGSAHAAGIGVGLQGDQRFFGHAGSTGVYWARFRVWPELGLAIVVATNGPVDAAGENAVAAAFDAAMNH